MRIIKARVFILKIPFKNAFSHSLKTRICSDSIIVELTADSGEKGYGEAVPRPYVTGETVKNCSEWITDGLLPAIAGRELPDFTEDIDPLHCMSNLGDLFPEPDNNNVIAMNASRAAIELACLDTLMKHARKSLAALIPPAVDMITYSAIISAETLESVEKTAQLSKASGIKQVKLKVGTENDLERIKLVRDIIGKDVSLRLDANAAFDEYGALSFIDTVSRYHIDCIEQPIPRGDIDALARVKAQSAIPVMVDESLVTEDDANRLIERDACDIFNLRIAKNGGIFRLIRLTEIARKAGKRIQLGCQVGETAILSAAGRHMAAHLSDAQFIEGSYGTYLLEEDIAAQQVMFGYNGKAPLLTGTGLGIDVQNETLEKFSQQITDINLE